MRAEKPTEALLIDGAVYIRQRDGSLRPAKDRSDRARIRALTDADIERMARKDGDNPASDASHWADTAIGLPPLKVDVHAKFDVDVVKWFKAQGRGYQTRMNAVLRCYMDVNAASRRAAASKIDRRRSRRRQGH